MYFYTDEILKYLHIITEIIEISPLILIKVK